MKTHILEIASCPSCGAKLDAASTVDEENPPVPGDVTVCLDCGVTLVFGDGLALRKFRRDEEAKLDLDARNKLNSFRAVIDRARRMS